MAKVLITGGAGFIGSRLTERLLADGREVVVIDSFDDAYDPEVKRRNLKSVADHPQLTLVEGDIRDQRLVERTYRRHGVAATVHLAARTSCRHSVKEPRQVAEVQQVGTATLLEAARKWGAYTFVLASSASVYGRSPERPLAEDCTTSLPISPYGAAKRAAELQCHAAHVVFGIKVSCLRLFTVVGPRQRPDMAVARWADAMLAGTPVPLYGEGAGQRDIVAVDDVAAGFVAALDAELDWGVLNLGSGVATPVESLVQLLADRLGRSWTSDLLPEQPGDLPITCADPTLAQRLLGWKASTSVDSSIDAFVQWRLSLAD